MARFIANPRRSDPYKTFTFRVKWDGRVVAGVSKVSALKRTTEVVSHRPGGGVSTPRRLPGSTAFEPITLERGISHDAAFEAWANAARQVGGGQEVEVGGDGFLKDIVIELCNEAGAVVLAYTVFRCWVSAYQALPDLDADASPVVIQSITLQHEGWERDITVPEPRGAKPSAKRTKH